MEKALLGGHRTICFCCPCEEAPISGPLRDNAPLLSPAFPQQVHSQTIPRPRAVLLVGFSFFFFKATILRLFKERFIQNLVTEHHWAKRRESFPLLVVWSQLRELSQVTWVRVPLPVWRVRQEDQQGGLRNVPKWNVARNCVQHGGNKGLSGKSPW